MNDPPRRATPPTDVDVRATIDALARKANRKIVSFEALAGKHKVVVIDLNGQHYHLRRTKSGRLVLTK